MHDAQGVGLAATQVGMLRRVFVFEPDEDEAPTRSSTRGSSTASDEKETDEEGCLSLRECASRSSGRCASSLEGKDPTGEDVRYELEGSPRGSCSTSSTTSTAC